MADEEMDVAGSEGLSIDSAMAEVDAQAGGEIPETAPTPQAQARAALGNSQPSQPSDGDYATLIQKMIDEENGVTPKQAVPDADKLPEGLDPKSGAAQRIQTLANARKEAESRATQFEQQVGQLQNYFGQFQQQAQQQNQQLAQQNHMLATQLAEMQGQMKIMAQHVNPQQQPMDDATRLKNEWLGDATKTFKEILSPMEQQLQESRQRYDNYVQEQQTAQLSNQVRDKAYDATVNIALRGFSEADVKSLAPALLPQILAIQMHTGADPAQAARIIRQTIQQAGLGLVRAYGKNATEALQKGKQVPSTAPTNRRTNGNGQTLPTLKQIQAAGYDNELDPEFMRRMQ